MDWNKIVQHTCAFGIMILAGCCIWLAIVLVHAIKRKRDLRKLMSKFNGQEEQDERNWFF